MKQQIQPDNPEHSEGDTATPVIKLDSLEQPDEDTVEPLMQPDNEEQPKANMALSWMKDIWKKIAKSG